MAKYGKIITKIIGNERHSFVVNGDSFFDVIEKAKNLSFPDVYRCGICGSDDLQLGCHTTKEDELQYEHITCRKCRSRVNFGHQKKSDIVYLRTKKTSDGNIMKDQNGFPVFDWKLPPSDMNQSNS